MLKHLVMVGRKTSLSTERSQQQNQAQGEAIMGVMGGRQFSLI